MAIKSLSVVFKTCGTGNVSYLVYFKAFRAAFFIQASKKNINNYCVYFSPLN